MEKVEGLESRIVELEGEVGGLEEELGKLNVRVSKLSVLGFPRAVSDNVSALTQNQDITIREMETRLLTMEKDIDEQVAQRVKGREVSWFAENSTVVPVVTVARLPPVGASQPIGS